MYGQLVLDRTFWSWSGLLYQFGGFWVVIDSKTILMFKVIALDIASIMHVFLSSKAVVIASKTHMSLFQKRLSLTQNYQNHTDTSGCCSFSSTHTQLTLTHFMHVSLSQVRSSLSQNAPFVDSKTDVIDSKTLLYFIGSKAVIICTQKRC